MDVKTSREADILLLQVCSEQHMSQISTRYRYMIEVRKEALPRSDVIDELLTSKWFEVINRGMEEQRKP
jgi:hypothetical protein